MRVRPRDHLLQHEARDAAPGRSRLDARQHIFRGRSDRVGAQIERDTPDVGFMRDVGRVDLQCDLAGEFFGAAHGIVDGSRRSRISRPGIRRPSGCRCTCSSSSQDLSAFSAARRSTCAGGFVGNRSSRPQTAELRATSPGRGDSA